MTRALLTCVLLLLPAPGWAQHVIQLSLTDEQLLELLALGPPATVVPVPAPEQRSLVLPTALYLSAVGAEWVAAAPACALHCNAWTRTLPTVNSAKVAVPLGLGINATVIAVVHYWVAPRWPRVADAVLFSAGAFHAASAVQHAGSARQTLKSGSP